VADPGGPQHDVPHLSRPDDPFEAVPAGVKLHLLIQPRASTNAVVGVHDGRIKIRLTAPPVEGAANEALIGFLAGTLDVSRSALELVAGHTGRRKTVVVTGIGIEEARALLGCR
jgi:uncharacterized protein